MIPEIICIECGRRYVGWALKFMKCYCKCGNWLNNDFNTKKEVKKVKKSVDYKKLPYFETKVVKVKRIECQHNTLKKIAITPYYATYQCVKCGLYFYPPIKDYKHKKIIKNEPKGNWVNGENLDKIKFPVLCSYKQIGTKYGLLIDEWDGYKIIPFGEQKRVLEYPFDKDLKHFITSWNIHILKGKIIIFENEEE